MPPLLSSNPSRSSPCIQLRPSLPEAVFGYVNLLVQQNRFEDAIPVVENALNASPENQQFRDLLQHVQSRKKN